MFYTENLSILLIITFFFVYYFLIQRQILSTDNGKNQYLAWASLAIYGVWYPPAIILVLFHSFLAVSIYYPLQRKSKTTLWGVIFLSLFILAIFKYYDFFTHEVMSNTKSSISLVLPIGISFYTFTIIGYYIDLFNGNVRPLTRFYEALLVIAFWPALASGPILRSQDFIKNMYQHFKITSDHITLALVLICTGLVKKLLLADNLASYVNWNIDFGVNSMNAIECLTTMLGFGSQIYFDFSGYTDMAIGFALLLGFRLPVNFNYPYASSSFTDFWRRWHISLSLWFRDYMYVPMGGKSENLAQWFTVILTVFILSGVWHGAGYGFFLWGMFHGLFLCIEKLGRKVHLRLPRPIGMVITFFLTMMVWSFFRLDANSAFIAIKKIIGLDGVNHLNMSSPYYVLPIVLICFGLIIDHVFKFYEVDDNGYPQLKRNHRVVYVYLGLFVVLAFLFSGKDQDFIYFQF